MFYIKMYVAPYPLSVDTLILEVGGGGGGG